jgi:hypothetical protein
MAFNKLSLEQRLLNKVEQVGACLLWIGQKDKKGYGRISVGGKVRRAHIVHFELHNGPVPEGKILMHSCDTLACIHLGHLTPGTQLENVHDMLAKGRANKCRGEKAVHAKLTEEQVLEIRRLYEPGKYGRGSHALAKQFGVSQASIHSILTGESWKHV